jgi:hypothetical protein
MKAGVRGTAPAWPLRQEHGSTWGRGSRRGGTSSRVSGCSDLKEVQLSTKHTSAVQRQRRTGQQTKDRVSNDAGILAAILWQTRSTPSNTYLSWAGGCVDHADVFQADAGPLLLLALLLLPLRHPALGAAQG